MSRKGGSNAKRSVRIVYSPRAEKELERLSAWIRGRILRKIEHYAEQDDPLRFAKILKPPLQGRWRFRIGEYRVIFRVGEDGEIMLLLILKVGHRKDVYG